MTRRRKSLSFVLDQHPDESFLARDQLVGFRRLVDRERVRDQFANIQLARENQPGHLALQGEVGRVTADQAFFVHANAR